MALTWNGDAVQKEIELRTGKLLVAAAITVQSELKKEMSRTVGPPSRPGEFLRQVTGNARESVAYEPTDPAAAGRAGKVRVGFAQRGWYAGVQEWFRGRLGLKAVVERLRGRLGQLLGGKP